METSKPKKKLCELVYNYAKLDSMRFNLNIEESYKRLMPIFAVPGKQYENIDQALDQTTNEQAARKIPLLQKFISKSIETRSFVETISSKPSKASHKKHVTFVI